MQKFKILELNYKFQVLEQQSEFFKIGAVLKFQNLLVMVRSGPGSTGSDALIPVYNQLVAKMFVGF